MDTVIRGLSIYFILLAATRLSGRRTLAQTTPFDLVLILIIAETTQQALLGDDFSITNAVVLIVTLFATDVALSFVKQKAPVAALVFDGAPTVLIADGSIDSVALKRARIDLDEILESARKIHGLERLDQIQHAVMETGGEISIVPKKHPIESPPA
jgi:uncharacterized membrane protein YcaP (DUF421 family)